MFLNIAFPLCPTNYVLTMNRDKGFLFGRMNAFDNDEIGAGAGTVMVSFSDGELLSMVEW